MSNVVPIHPYQILGRMDERLDRITAYAVMWSDNDILLYHVTELRKLQDALRQALEDLQRSRLTEQLEASIASVKGEKR